MTFDRQAFWSILSTDSTPPLPWFTASTTMTNIACDRICPGNAHNTVDETSPTRRTIAALPSFAPTATEQIVRRCLYTIHLLFRSVDQQYRPMHRPPHRSVPRQGLPCDHGLDFDISLCENSINQHFFLFLHDERMALRNSGLMIRNDWSLTCSLCC